jgi:hypothetical protein
LDFSGYGWRIYKSRRVISIRIISSKIGIEERLESDVLKLEICFFNAGFQQRIYIRRYLKGKTDFLSIARRTAKW